MTGRKDEINCVEDFVSHPTFHDYKHRNTRRSVEMVRARYLECVNVPKVSTPGTRGMMEEQIQRSVPKEWTATV